MKKRPFLVLSGAFVFGEVCCYVSLTAAAVVLFASIGIGAAAWAGVLPPLGLMKLAGYHFGGGSMCAYDDTRRYRDTFLLVPALFLVGMLRMADASEWSGLAARATEAEAQVKVRAVLQVDEIRRTDSSLQFYTRTIQEIEEHGSDALIPEEKMKKMKGAVVTLKGDEEAARNIRIGDVITGEGTFTLFDAATNFGQFDLRQYYKAQGLEGRLKLNSWSCVSGSRFRLSDVGANLVYRGKQFLLGRLYEAVEEGEEADAGLLGAILLGEKSGISDEDQKLFQESGISHMYAVSGLHASFFGWGLYGILKKLGASRKLCSAAAGIGLWTLVIAAGGSVSVKRAFCMFLLALLAGLAGRTYDLPIGLSAACMLILWERPLMLFQSGFQLSFCAVLGIAAAASVMGGDTHEEEADSRGERKKDKISEKHSGYKRERYSFHRSFRMVRAGKIGSGETDSNKTDIDRRGFREQDFSKSKKYGKRGKWERRKKQFIKGLTASLWIQLVLLPPTLWNFFQYPCYGILLNLVVIPMLSAVLALGFFAMALSCVWVTGAGYCLLPVRGIFWFWRFLCGEVRRLPGALWLTGRPKAACAAMFCAFLLCFWMCSLLKKWGRRSWYPGCLALLLLTSLAFLDRRPEAGLQVTFLDVGQGDGIYMREESGYTMMIDGGSSDGWKVGENRILPMMKALGNSQVDDWFLSHPDQDHLSGLKEILAVGFPVERLWVPEVFRENKAVLELAELAEENGTEVRFTRPGVLVSDRGGGESNDMRDDGSVCDSRRSSVSSSVDGSDGFILTCLYPEPEEPIASTNDGSMVLLAQYEGVNILFTGDLESSGEARLLARSDRTGQLSCDILKVGHHGSKGSTSQPFLEELNPFFAVISCGRDNSYGHPHAELLSRLEEQKCKVVTTMEEGAVTLRIYKGKIYDCGQ